MTELHGVTGAPYKTPQVRKVMPAPHERKRIDMDGGSRVKRSWKDTPVTDIQAGDLVANVGLVTFVGEFLGDHDDEALRLFWTFRLTNALDEHFRFPGHERLYAFTKDPT